MKLDLEESLEIWILRHKLKTAGTKFMRSTEGYRLLDHRGNEDILEELKVDPVEKKLVQYK
jgi:hypothetical protein